MSFSLKSHGLDLIEPQLNASPSLTVESYQRFDLENIIKIAFKILENKPRFHGVWLPIFTLFESRNCLFRTSKKSIKGAN